MTTTTGPTVSVFDDRAPMGEAAAADIAAVLRTRLADPSARVRMVFAAAPSQREALENLRLAPDIDWARVTAFHMDDYIGLADNAPERFASWLREVIFDQLPFGKVELLRTDGDPAERAAEYALLLAEAPIDIVVLGIGVNGHIAFNDPPVADFDDPHAVKVVELDDVCRQQQVDDGCFPTFADVPTHALTLTIPRLLDAERLFCVVPGSVKAPAVRKTLHDPISTDVPATALRNHGAVRLYLDRDSAGELD